MTNKTTCFPLSEAISSSVRAYWFISIPLPLTLYTLTHANKEAPILENPNNRLALHLLIGAGTLLCGLYTFVSICLPRIKSLAKITKKCLKPHKPYHPSHTLILSSIAATGIAFQPYSDNLPHAIMATLINSAILLSLNLQIRIWPNSTWSFFPKLSRDFPSLLYCSFLLFQLHYTAHGALSFYELIDNNKTNTQNFFISSGPSLLYAAAFILFEITCIQEILQQQQKEKSDAALLCFSSIGKLFPPYAITIQRITYNLLSAQSIINSSTNASQPADIAEKNWQTVSILSITLALIPSIILTLTVLERQRNIGVRRVPWPDGHLQTTPSETNPLAPQCT